MLSDNVEWHATARARLIHSIWNDAVLAMDLAVQKLADAGENRHAAQLDAYSSSVAQAAERHMLIVTSSSNGNGHHKDSNGHAVSLPPLTNGVPAETCASAEQGVQTPCSKEVSNVAAQPRDTVTEIDEAIEALSSWNAFVLLKQRDPQAWETAHKFYQRARGLALVGSEDLAQRVIAAAKNILAGGREV
jgi:hypothetical protein